MSVTISNVIRPMNDFRKWAYKQTGDWGSYVLFKGQKFLVTRYTALNNNIQIRVTEDQFEPARPGYVCGSERVLAPGSGPGEVLRVARSTLLEVHNACKTERARQIDAVDEKSFPSEMVYKSLLAGTTFLDVK